MSWAFGEAFCDSEVLICTARSKTTNKVVEVQTDLLVTGSRSVAVLVDGEVSVIESTLMVPCVAGPLSGLSDSLIAWMRAGGVMVCNKAEA